VFRHHAAILGISGLGNSENRFHPVLSSMPAVLLTILMGGSLRADDWAPLWTTATLSQPRTYLAAAVSGTEILFGGGFSGSSDTAQVDIYDVASNTWSTSALSHARYNLGGASVGALAFFGPGNSKSGGYSDAVDIYDSASDTWSTTTRPHESGFYGMASAGNKAVIAGGFESSAIDVYNTTTSSWSSPATLSQTRAYVAAASANDKVLFAGGLTPSIQPSNVVDIFNTTTGVRTTATLPVGRFEMTAASAGSKALFAGGYLSNGGPKSNAVNIYDATNGSWSTGTLSTARCNMAAASVGTKVMFAGGVNSSGVASNVVDVYDTASGIWSTMVLPHARFYGVAASVGNKLVIAGGQGSGLNDNAVDIYTLQNYQTITSAKPFTLVDATTVAGRMELNTGASLNLGGYNLNAGSMAGVAPVNLSNHTLIVGADNTNSSYSGAISGDGNLSKTGSGTLALAGDNSFLGLTSVNAGELVLMGPNAWNPIVNLGGAYLSGGEIVFDYTGSSDPYVTVRSLLNTKINGSMPLTVADDTVNNRVTVSLAVPEPSSFVLAATGLVTLFACSWRRKSKNVNRLPTK
jgi:autotransporter-associated beta strand protein